MPDAVLTINAGSSSIKFALFGAGGDLPLVSRGQIEGIGVAPHFQAKAASGEVLAGRRWTDTGATHEALLDALLEWVESHLGNDRLVAVGHRVLHGGVKYLQPARVTPEVLGVLERLVPLGPLHQPHNISPMRAIAAMRPNLPQVACFDTSFHCTMPEVATRLALPRSYEAEGVRRYGFHGLSYEYIARRLRKVAPGLVSGRVVTAHLGNGVSLCAMRDGRSVDTTMSFTPLDGLMMGTRCGGIDPGAILYLLQRHGMNAAQLESLLWKESGLLGVSGISSDMRPLLESDKAAAREAVELFVFRIARETGALMASLGGLDGFVFTAGIGENAAAVREAVCARLAWTGMELDEAANTRGEMRISTAKSRVAVLVVPTNEEAMIARHTVEIVGVGGAGSSGGKYHS
jgi:acetate kinase